MTSRRSLDGRRRLRRGSRNIHQSTARQPARVFYHLAHEKQQAPRCNRPPGRSLSPTAACRRTALARALRGARVSRPSDARYQPGMQRRAGERRSADAPRPSPATDPVEDVRRPERKQQNQYQRIDAHDAPALWSARDMTTQNSTGTVTAQRNFTSVAKFPQILARRSALPLEVSSKRIQPGCWQRHHHWCSRSRTE